MDVVCSGCGAPWPAGQSTCAACGGTVRTLLGGAHFREKGNLQAFANVTETVWKKSWPWIIVYGLVQIVLVAVSYWTSGFVSVAWSFLGSVISTVIGLFIAWKIVTINPPR
jgi:hypothetical protein